MNKTIFTLGHSNHSIGLFIGLLDRYNIDTVCDVRSSPYSRFNPHFSQKTFKESLRQNNKKYVFLGKELGARSEDPTCYVDGKVQYSELARSPIFRKGIERLEQGLNKGYVIALVCAEKDPLDCHRTILVAQALVDKGIDVRHILSDGTIESHWEAIDRLIRQFRLHQDDLFMSEHEITRKALQKQEERIAYVDEAQLAEAGKRY